MTGSRLEKQPQMTGPTENDTSATVNDTSKRAPPANLDRVPARAGYDRWAKIYDAYDNPLVALETPVVRHLLGDVSGLEIADVGCGTGRHTVPLAQNGARVTGIDFSEGMLAQARTKVVGLPVELIRHDLATELPLRRAAFDRVISCLVIEHIHDLDTIFLEMARICRPGGFVVVSDLHPDMVRDSPTPIRAGNNSKRAFITRSMTIAALPIDHPFRQQAPTLSPSSQAPPGSLAA